MKSHFTKLFFTACVLLSSVYVNADTYFTVDGIRYGTSDGKTAYVTTLGSGKYSGNITIPFKVTDSGTTYSVTSIGNSKIIGGGEDAFYGCTGLTSITIPNSVTSIGYCAFYGCTSLTSIEIPNSVVSIIDGAFAGCTNLTSIEISNSFTSIALSAFRGTAWLESQPDGLIYINNILYKYKGIMPGNTKIKIKEGTISINNRAFAGYIDIASIEIPNSVISIGSQAFADCTSLTSIEIPNSVTSIGSNAFYCCTGLTSIIISSVASIGNNAFYGCRSLESLIIQNKNATFGYSILIGCVSLKYLEAPASVFDVQESSLTNTSKQISTIIVNGGTLSADGFAFINRQQKSLKTLDMSGAINEDIADEAFYNCYKLENLTLPSTLKTLGYKSFAECVALKSLNVPASVTEIGDRCFENCRSMGSLTFGGSTRSTLSSNSSNLKTIGNWSFYNCHELKNITIPESVESIGLAAFYGCTYLEELTLPSSLRSAGDNCFAKCENLGSIRCAAATPPTIDERTFYDVSRQIPVYVPIGSVDAYKDDPLWGEFDIQGLTSVGETSAEPSWKSNISINEKNISIANIDVSDIHIYNTAGKQVSNPVPTAGVYVVTVGGEAVKVAVP